MLQEYAKIDGEDTPFLSSSPASRGNRELSVDRVVMLRGQDESEYLSVKGG